MPDMFYPGQQDYITKLNELSNSIVPATGTIAELQQLTSGGGRLTSATDVAAIVQLNGAPGSGTVAEYCPMYPGTYVQGASTTTFKPVHPSITGAHTFNIKAPDSSTSSNGGRLYIYGGNNDSTGAGGAVNIYAGSNNVSGNGGAILLTAGSGTGYGGNITLQVNSANATQGYIALRANSSTVIKVGPAASTLGFYSATPVTKPVVAGSHGSNAALQSLLSALNTLGLISDTTTA